MTRIKSRIKKFLRNSFPNIRLLSMVLTEIKIKEINKYRMRKEDIEEGESSFAAASRLVSEYSKRWPNYSRELQKKTDEYICKCEPLKERKDIEKLKIKVLFSCYAYGFQPDEFFALELENMEREESRLYFSNRDVSNFVYTMNDIIDVDLFFDKFKTYEKYRKYYKREAISIEKEADFNIFDNFVKRHPVFVKKNVVLSKGNSVECIDVRENGQSIHELFEDMISKGKHIIEERVLQSEPMSRLNPSSVNTVRCMTFRTKNGIVIGPCFLKVGQTNSFVDNGGKGGILIGINNRNGILETNGYDEFLNEYKEHPGTKEVFNGMQLPEWEQLRSLAIELSEQTPKVKYISWDFAHTTSGWVVIEGNGSGQMIVPQIVWKRGFKKEIFEQSGVLTSHWLKGVKYLIGDFDN